MKDLRQLIKEALRSYPIDMVEKRIDQFFAAKGYKKKMEFGEEIEAPYYQIFSDRIYLKRRVEDYKDKNHDMTQYMMNRGNKQEDLIGDAEIAYNDFTHGDISIFAVPNTPELTKNILQLIDSVGYFIASAHLDSVGDFKLIEDKSKIVSELPKQKRLSIFIEPYYDKQEKGEDYLYHVTSKNNIEKIMRVGLVPKSKNTRSFYPERIYLSPNEKYMNSILNQLQTDKEGEYVKLKIKNNGLKLYKDVRFKGGFYTYDNIHPKDIEQI